MIKLTSITKEQDVCEAFGLSPEQSMLIKQELAQAAEKASTWTELITRALSEDDTPLVEAFKLFTLGEVCGMVKAKRGNGT